MADKHEYDVEKTQSDKDANEDTLVMSEEIENSRIEAVALVVPVTDDPSLNAITFRYWIIASSFSIIGAIIQQYYFYRTTSGSFSIFFVNLASYSIGKFMEKYLPVRSVSLGRYSMSLNPGPFNIKEHALIGITVSTAAGSAYAIDILSATDLFLNYRIGVVGSLILIITTQCVGYGMAGLLRRYLVYPAEMVWWSNLVQVVFYNGMHSTGEFKTMQMIRGWSYMKYFWVFCTGMFIYEFIPQLVAPLLVTFDWICWLNPFNKNVWALFSSISGGGIFSLSFDWTSIGGATMWLPLSAQLCTYGGMVLNYWIILPIFWLNNVLGTKSIGKPLTSHLFYDDGTPFNIKEVLNPDYTVNWDLYNAGKPANMAPMYALGFMTSFIALAGCVSHIICFHGSDIIRNWKAAVGSDREDIHTKLMKVYPEVPQLWYAAFYVTMAGLAIVVCEVYELQLPWWGLIVSLIVGFLLTLPICAMVAITGFGPGLNVITELVCGYMLPGKPIANMTFKCYGYMAMYQCQSLLSDLKLGHYMKIPPRSMFIGQFWGTLIGAVFNYLTMVFIIDSQRGILNGTKDDPTGLWTGQRVDTFWGSGLIYGALGPAKMFAFDGKYWFVYIGFLIGFVVPVILWALSKVFPQYQWSKFNVAIIAGGMGAYPNGYAIGVFPSIIVCLIFQGYIFRYHKGWWKKYVFVLSAALDTGAAFTGLIMFLFFSGGISPKLSLNFPHWWGNYADDNGTTAPYMSSDRCGSYKGQNWTGGV
ncbi:OPT superfamily oligopeptide transporter [Linnemannia elongata AG-77]|uniref:OPT superfamily oligopeptide transporter n=1 Tax=Linnemannia elongata AG-77 TaxID=1314771 RepID=A0A197K0S7_9FUNG|nr:OPT superfamily oligopeptide transporter [Linnemannia elongata AG-77]